MRGKVLITGGFGNLGSWLTTHFSAQGFDVYVLTRKEKIRLEDVVYKVIEADIADIEALKSQISMDFDICIHTASLNEHFLDNYPQEALLTNALGTRNLLEALCVYGVKKFIYMSTFHVYGVNSGHITEETPLFPKNDYATTHLFAEYYIKQFAFTCKLNYTIFRLTNSYGCPIDSSTDKWYLVLNDLAKSAYENQKIVLKTNGEALRDFIWMGDVCNIIEQATNLNTCDTFNLSAGKSYKIVEIAKMVKNIYEKRYSKIVPIEINKEDKNSYDVLFVDNNKLKRVIDFSLNDKFEEEINKIFDLLEQENG